MEAYDAGSDGVHKSICPKEQKPVAATEVTHQTVVSRLVAVDHVKGPPRMLRALLFQPSCHVAGPRSAHPMKKPKLTVTQQAPGEQLCAIARQL